MNKKIEPPKCVFCGSRMVLRTTTKFTYNNGQPRKFYGCRNFPQCTGVHGADPDGVPLGKPATKTVRDLRIKAHNLFDQMWKPDKTKKGEAYSWLAKYMKMPAAKCHFGMMNEKQCKKAINILEGRMWKYVDKSQK